MPNFTGSVTETERYGCEDGDLGLCCDEPDTLLCYSIIYNKIKPKKKSNRIKQNKITNTAKKKKKKKGNKTRIKEKGVADS